MNGYKNSSTSDETKRKATEREGTNIQVNDEDKPSANTNKQETATEIKTGFSKRFLTTERIEWDLQNRLPECKQVEVGQTKRLVVESKNT